MMRMRRRNVIIAIAATALVCFGLGVYTGGTVMWNAYEGNVKGVRIEGDASAPPTRWYNHAFLALWGWKKVAVLRVADETRARSGYRVGYKPFEGPSRVNDEVFRDPAFRMKVGREDPIFFAVGLDGIEIPLEVLAVTDVSDARYASVPLH